MREFVLKSVLNTMYFSGAQAMSGFWAGGHGAIMMLHHVRNDDKSEFAPNRHLQISPVFLDRLLAATRSNGYEFVSMDEIYYRYARNDLDPNKKLLAITLDDGYRDNLENAVPVFRKHNAPYTIYIAPGLVDGRADLWWEDLSAIIASKNEISIALPKGRKSFETDTLGQKNSVFKQLLYWLTTDVSEEQQRKVIRELAWMNAIDTNAHCKAQIMDWQQIHELAKDPLCTIGAHTIHHYAVARLDEAEAEWEMRESANILQSELGTSPRHFAYPYGYPAAAGIRDFKLAGKLGFETAVTTRHGVLQKEHSNHLHALPRISVNGNFQAMRYINTLLSGLPALIENRAKRISVD